MLEDDIPFEANLDEALDHAASRASWGQRMAVLALTVLVGIFLFVAVIGRDTGTTAFNATGVRYTLLLTSDVTWGTFSITRGHERRDFANDGTPQLSAAYSAPAAFDIALSAPPFAVQICHLSLPSAETDTCHGLSVLATGMPDDQGVMRLNVHFVLTLADLPPAMGNMLTQEIIPSFLATTPQVGIPVGSHYAIGGLLTSDYLTTTPLTALLQTTPGNTTRIPDRSCLDICGTPDSLPPDSGAPMTWHARIFVDQQWHIMRRDGTTVGSITESTLPRPLDLDLNYDPSTQAWAIAPPLLMEPVNTLSLGMCDDGEVALASLYFVPNSLLSNFTTSPLFDSYQINGCILHLKASDDSGGTPADFLWRLGRLYAANATAHTVAPAQPVATAQDLAALGG